MPTSEEINKMSMDELFDLRDLALGEITKRNTELRDPNGLRVNGRIDVDLLLSPRYKRNLAWLHGRVN